MDKLNAVIELDQVTVRYGDQIALDQVSLRVDEKSFIAIIGPNGGGKTTLIRSILGLQPISSGTVKLWGESPQKNRHQVGYVPQTRYFDRSFPITVKEVVEMGGLSNLYSRKISKSEQSDRVQKAIERLQIGSLLDRQVSQLSGGELQRTLIARALAADARMLILDEATANIDPKATALIYQILVDLNQHIPIVTVSHDLGVVAQFVKTIACVNRCLHYHDSKELTPTMLEEAYGCPVDLIAHGQTPHRVLSKHTGHAHD